MKNNKQTLSSFPGERIAGALPGLGGVGPGWVPRGRGGPGPARHKVRLCLQARVACSAGRPAAHCRVL